MLTHLKATNLRDLAGTNLAMTIPISQALLQDILDARPESPAKELKVKLLNDDRAILDLAIDAPVVGMTRRTLELKLKGTVEPGRQDWLFFEITDGLRFFDKPLLNLASSLLADKFPGGVKLDSDGLSLHLGQMIEKSGNGFILPAIAAARLNSKAGQLILNLHLKVNK